MKVFIALGVASLILLSACNKKVVADKHTQTLDSLVDVAFVDLNYILAVDTQMMKSMSPVIDEYLKFFTRDNFDENNKELYTNEISTIALCKKYISRSKNNLTLWREMAEINHNQLVTLRHDYSHQLISEEELLAALGEEIPALSKTHQLISKNVVSVLNCQDSYNKTIDRLDSIRLDYLSKK